MVSRKDKVLLIYPSSGIENSNLLPLFLLCIAQPLFENNIQAENVSIV